MNHPTSQPIPTHQGPPASSSPLRDLFSQNRTSVSEDGHYVVLPARVLEQMPLPWQQQLATLLGQLQAEQRSAAWPYYRVQSCRVATVAELPEDKLREVGIIHELNDEGDMVHRNLRTGEHIAHPEQYRVLVTGPDPLLNSAPSP